MRTLQIKSSVFSGNGESSRLERDLGVGFAIGPDRRNKSIAAARASAQSLALQTRLAA